VHGEAGTRAWRGWASSSAWARSGACTHARGAWLPRTAARPCRARGTGAPGPRHDAAARGDGGSGGMSGASGSCKKKWHGGRRDRGILRPTTVGSSAARGTRRQQWGENKAAVVVLTGGAEEGGTWGCGEARQVGCCRAGRSAASMSSYGRRLGVVLGLLRGSGGVGGVVPELSSSSSPRAVAAGRRRGAGARVSAAAVGVLWGGPRARGRRQRGLLGVRAGTRGGPMARLGLGLGSAGGRGGGKEERARVVAAGCRGAGTGARAAAG
jgi:hypothetical protein